jgi:membrane protease YdiL (CAAX protease family)
LSVARRMALGLVVVASMVALFSVPAEYFIAATFISTGCMVAAAYYSGGLRKITGPRPLSIAVGLATAAALYLVFYLGGAAIDLYHPLGVTSASESSIYSLIASPSNPLVLQVSVLFFDAAGFETYFRGVLQKGLTPRLGLGAAPVIALFDAGIHAVTLNPVWVVATFVTDLVWGITYHYGRGTQSSFLSHLVWDLAIFIVRPVT